MNSEQRTPSGVPDLVTRLARGMINLRVGDRMPTVRELAREHGASLASVHAALSRLQDERAVVLDHRGRGGTFVQERALDRLWAAAEGSPVVIALTLPSTRRFEGLATGLKALLSAAGVPTFLTFIRGSRQRLEALRQGRCHIAVMSSFAAGQLGRYEETTVLDLYPGSFVEGHRVFFVDEHPAGRRPRVVVDRDSVDQQRITEMEFEGHDVELLPSTYLQIARLFQEGRADAAVWTVDEMAVSRPEVVHERELSGSVRERLGDAPTRAALVARAEDLPVRAVVNESIDRDRLERIQADVIAGRIVPEY